jgi:hypothetical protein
MNSLLTIIWIIQRREHSHEKEDMHRAGWRHKKVPGSANDPGG